MPDDPLMHATLDFSARTLKVAGKYDMDKVTKLLLPRVLQAWPTTLHEWGHIQGRTRALRDLKVVENMIQGDDDFAWLDKRLVEPARVIQSAKACCCVVDVLLSAILA